MLLPLQHFAAQVVNLTMGLIGAFGLLARRSAIHLPRSLMHKINGYLRFLHVQHVLLDRVGVSVRLSGTVMNRSSP